VARNLVAHLDRQMALAENFGAAEEIPGIVGKMRGKIRKNEKQKQEKNFSSENFISDNFWRRTTKK